MYHMIHWLCCIMITIPLHLWGSSTNQNTEFELFRSCKSTERLQRNTPNTASPLIRSIVSCSVLTHKRAPCRVRIEQKYSLFYLCKKNNDGDSASLYTSLALQHLNTRTALSYSPALRLSIRKENRQMNSAPHVAI